MNATEVARPYYTAIDEDRYDDLTDLLATEFVHERPDRTLDGRETFVAFMREERPRTDTTHEIDGVYADETGDDTSESAVAVRGRLFGEADGLLFGFVDVHTVDGSSIARIHTYTD